MRELKLFFLQEGCLDHTTAILKFYREVTNGRKAFKYFKMWSSHPDFLSIVKVCWNVRDAGTKMFQVVTKLKRLKGEFKKLNRAAYANIQQLEEETRKKLEIDQVELGSDPLNISLQKKEQESRRKYVQVRKANRSFLHQKAKINWIKEEDINSAFYHAYIKNRRRNNRVLSIINEEGVRVYEEENIKKVFLEFYGKHLGISLLNRKHLNIKVMRGGTVLTELHRSVLMKNYTR